jgi:hypothetical protein
MHRFLRVTSSMITYLDFDTVPQAWDLNPTFYPTCGSSSPNMA